MLLNPGFQFWEFGAVADDEEVAVGAVFVGLQSLNEEADTLGFPEIVAINKDRTVGWEIIF